MMAQRLTLEIDLTNEDSDSGDTNVSSQAHPPPISLPITTTTTAVVVESSTTTTTNVSGIANCCGDSNITAENVCQMATTSAAAAAAQNQPGNQSSDNNALEEGATGFDNNRDVLECPICLQTCIHPARLPCGHIFCFLCVKGVAYKNRRCAMCRREIPVEFLDFPQLVNGIKDICATTATDDGYQWFYEGRNGNWWLYDKRSAEELELFYQSTQNKQTDVIDLTIELKYNLLVCGVIYIIDIENWVQYPQHQPNRRRRIKRICKTQNAPQINGVAGIITSKYS